MARTTAPNAEFVARAKARRRGEDTAEEVVPITTVPAAPQTDRAPPTTAPTGTSGAVSRPRLIVKRPDSGAAAATAGDKGKKTQKDDSPAVRPSKKQKHGGTSASLADAFLGGGVRLDDEVFLQLGPRMTEALKDVSEEDALRTAGELTLRLAALYTKFPRPERSRVEDLEKELAAAKTELDEMKASAADLKAQFDRLNGIKAEHAKCAGLLKATDDRVKAEQAKAGEAADELRKLQRRFDDLSLEHLAAVGSASDWQKKAKDLEAELGVADEQVFAHSCHLSIRKIIRSLGSVLTEWDFLLEVPASIGQALLGSRREPHRSDC
ncbi:hypothetical protein DEO72_LG1g3177 [Vigna unguiculata]|uniref:Uncharacterized protein n=1 Tax=Vigna unguiculata TaxID=3917 RepID=A0A4D6KSL2_VIGUN|nr:hypothetical protein DEO72_LG1g3177 [Vigna unguiculata]